ncbi:MAG: 50S ribosomal protein L23 [Aquificaceae bacterium]|nr:50S ribosomal protein L23 [Aquificaceae bacterium]MCX7989808.1 50S ribosomal protein L23 [Aquificaceae bacterium]
MKRPEEVIIRPIITEKSNRLMEDQKKYTFEVAMDATKQEVRHAVEKLFGVKVLKVNTLIVKPRKKRVIGKFRRYGYTRAYKKAVVTIPADKELDLTGV